MPVRVVERVKRVKQLLLGLPLVLKKVNVVKEQHIHKPVLVLKRRHTVVPYGLNKLVGKTLGGAIDNFPIRVVVDIVAYGLHKMGFPQPNPAVYEKRVIRHPRVPAYGNGRVGREIIVVPYHIPLKRVILP